MINPTSIENELRNNFLKRVFEMRFLENQLKNFEDENEQEVYRKSLVVMLYSHFEGFFKEALDSFYIDILNNENIPIKEANYAIQACSLLDVFKDLQDGTNKSEIFKKALPDDSKLHIFHRRLEFIERLGEVFEVSITSKNRFIKIPTANQEKRPKEDKHVRGLVDTESNLKPIVISKILFQLGFSDNHFKSYESDIIQLLSIRNEIGHGTFTRGVQKSIYFKLKISVFRVCKALIKLIINALQNKEYLKEEFR